MRWWRPAADRGEWVRTTKVVPLGVTDRMLNRGLPRGTRGVVVARQGGRLRVEFDTGWGLVSGTVRRQDVQVLRHGGGAERFRARTGLLACARLAVAVVLALPVLQFVVAHLWAYRSFDGIASTFALAALGGAEQSLLAALHQPKKALAYVIVLTLLSRFAFGRRAQ